MMWFLLAAGLLAAMATAVLLAPLVRRSNAPVDDREPVIAVSRERLAEIEADEAAGLIPPEEAEAARTEVARGLVDATAGAQPGVAKPNTRGEMLLRVGAAAVIAGVVPAGAFAIYLAVGSPQGIGTQPVAAASQESEAAELEVAADRLRTRLADQPGDVDGWVLLGRTLTALGKFSEARDAYGRAVKLAPDEPELHAQIGELLVVEAKGAVTDAALAEFAKAGDDPRSRYYGAEAALQRGDAAGAAAILAKLLAEAPAEAPWRAVVAGRLNEIKSGAATASTAPSGPAPSPSPPAAAAPGPSAADVAAAQSMSVEDRQAMIRGMVERLAARLEQEPGDKEGWARLARAYEVLGEPDKAAAARAKAEGR